MFELQHHIIAFSNPASVTEGRSHSASHAIGMRALRCHTHGHQSICIMSFHSPNSRTTHILWCAYSPRILHVKPEPYLVYLVGLRPFILSYASQGLQDRSRNSNCRFHTSTTAWNADFLCALCLEFAQSPSIQHAFPTKKSQTKSLKGS